MNEKHYVYEGNCPLPTLDPSKITKIMAAFTRMFHYRKIKWRYFIEISKKEHLHFHFVLICKWAQDINDLRTIMHTKLGTTADCHIEKVDGIGGIAKYITGHCNEKKYRNIFNHQWKCKLSNGSKGFYKGGN